MIRDASISEDGLYRYRLRRIWDAGSRLLTFIMLNPSTADAYKDDATIRVCMGRARQGGYGGIVVLNLFAYRATNPKVLSLVDDPVGPQNDATLRENVNGGSTVIVAWGAHGRILRRGPTVVSMLVRELGVDLYCLRATKEGAPAHPLRIPYSEAPKLWMRAGAYTLQRTQQR